MHRLLVAVLLKLLNTGVAQESAAATTTTAAIATMELSNGISRPVGYDVWPPRNLRIVRNWNSTTVGNEAILQELVEPPVPPYLLPPELPQQPQPSQQQQQQRRRRRRPPPRVVLGQRQLFVDDLLVQHTTLARAYLRPRPENDGRPVMPPVTLSHDPPNVPYPGGLHNCPASSDGIAGRDVSGGGEREFRLYWHEYKKDRVELATSKDLVHWTRRKPTRVDAGRPTQRVPCLGLNDAWTFMTPDDDGSCRTMYAFAKSCPRLGPGVVFQLAANGTVWERIAETGKTHDRGSFWWNPFSRHWAFNVRLDFSGYARSLWYWEAPHPLTSAALDWLVPEKWRGKFSPKDWRRELEKDWAQAAATAGANGGSGSGSGSGSGVGGMQPGVRLPVPFIAPNARDQRDTPNYNNDLTLAEGDCTPRTCGATHRTACLHYRMSYMKWSDAHHGSTASHPPPPPQPPKELLPDRCVRLTDIYAMEPVPYESVLVGLFAIWQGGQTGELKHMQVWAGFTRDGFHFHRPAMPASTLDAEDTTNGLTKFAGRDADPSARGAEQGAFLRYPGAGWRNVQPVANGIQNLDDRAYVMYTARHQRARKSGVFLSSLRRDGFAAMRCRGANNGQQQPSGGGQADVDGDAAAAEQSTTCTLTTVPFVVDLAGVPNPGNLQLRVNADAYGGKLTAGVLSPGNTDAFPDLSTEECFGLQRADSTDHVIRWAKNDDNRNTESLASIFRESDGPSTKATIQLRFVAEGEVDLFSFWFATG